MRLLSSARARRAGVLVAALALLAADLGAIGFGAVASGHRVRTGAAESPGPAPTVATSTSTTALSTTSTVARATPTSSTATTARASQARTYGSPGTTAASSPSTVAANPAACAASGCVTIDATSDNGPANQAGAGINVVGSQDGNGSILRSLRTSMFRSAPTINSLGSFDWTSWDAGASSGAQTTLILSDLWLEKYHGTPPTPWSNWTNYIDWVKSTVQEVMISGRRVDYWDIYNEPGWRNYYSSSDFQTETPQDLLQQFLVSYQAIRSVDPTAAIVGPSIGHLTFTPVPANDSVTHEPDMTTFLQFAAAYHIQLAAVAWHDNSLPPWGVVQGAQQVWALIRSLPALGHPQMFLDEYARSWNQPIPGWDVGFLAAITDSGISSGVRSCWDGCLLPTVDGLMLKNGGVTSSDYYDRLTYARMTGRMVRWSSTDGHLTAVGSIDSARQSVTALVGRMVGCALASWCKYDWPPGYVPVGPASVQVHVIVPWTTKNVSVQLSYEPFQPDGSSGPITVAPQQPTLQGYGPGREMLSFTIPAFADGSAYNVSVTGS